LNVYAQKRKRDAKEASVSDSGEYSQDEVSNEGSPNESDSGEEEFGGFGPVDEWEDEDDPLATSDEGEDDGSEIGSDKVDDDVPEDEFSDSSEDSDGETQAEKDRKAAYFDSEIPLSEAHSSFLTMNLSRPILKAITALGFHKPTPIQAATIPVALMGKDVVGGAVTGSGKTAAFIIPMIERLLYREKGKKAAATRCLVLVPTRELAIQCFEVGIKLATQTDIRFSLIVGTYPYSPL
jgi:ATP-dependent RNA helicase DDX27